MHYNFFQFLSGSRGMRFRVFCDKRKFHVRIRLPELLKNNFVANMTKNNIFLEE
jgi:hypothetical protein